MATRRAVFESDFSGTGVGGTTLNLPHIVVQISERDLMDTCIATDDQHWQPSAVNGLWARLDPIGPERGQRRYVHLAQRGSVGPADQATWWDDVCTPPARRDFNPKFGSRLDVKTIAKQALDLAQTTILEKMGAKAISLVLPDLLGRLPNAVMLRVD